MRRLLAAPLLLCLILGVARYFSLFGDGTEPDASRARQGAAGHVGPVASVGREAVVAPPSRSQAGVPSAETTPVDAFSSNPPRSAAEEQVLSVARTQIPDKAKVAQLLAMIPDLPEDGRVLALEQAAELIPDTDYLRYRGRLFRLADSGALREAVMDDALTRGEEVRLPTIVQMLRLPISKQEEMEIREILEAYLDRDYGSDPSKWEAPVRQWVARSSER